MGKFFTFKNKRHMPLFLAHILAGVMRLYAWTLRLTIDDPENEIPKMTASPRVMVIWHNRILFVIPLFPKIMRKHAQPLISTSRDGEYIATVIKCFGVSAIRGSSSRGGATAMLNFHEAIADNNISPVLTVDGPRGPKYCVHPGAGQLARLHKIPIMPFGINCRHYWQLKSWDNMQIPWPFSKVTLKIGKCQEIPVESTIAEANDIIYKALQGITED